MNDIYNMMLQEHDISSSDSLRNATYEVMQQVVLGGLYRGGFFKEAAFYGGTCLRIFHKLGRYSEDMDFSLLEKNPEFHFEDYFQAIIEEAKLLGREVIITKKDKTKFGKVESAFLKDNTDVYNLDRTETAYVAFLVQHTLLYPPLSLCWQDARLGIPCMEEPHQGARLV